MLVCGNNKCNNPTRFWFSDKKHNQFNAQYTTNYIEELELARVRGKLNGRKLWSIFIRGSSSPASASSSTTDLSVYVLGARRRVNWQPERERDLRRRVCEELQFVHYFILYISV